MNWQIASFALLGLVLFAGFAWYERSRPPAKVLALVAALAALAIVGRIAFAPFPNVKPTTDIVLLSGYALGGAPGFAVGAVTALVSNVFFGHGPWTPWQMAGWGGVGIAGAALARSLRGRELGRLGLALACGAAGAAFGLLMDVYQWTLAAEQTLASYVAVSGTSLPYNAAHVIGNFVFCLVIGPPLVRALRRYRERFEVRWAPVARGVAAPTALALVAGLVLALPGAAGAASGSQAAARFLERAQNGDGGFGGGAGSSSNQLFTGWAALGLAAAGENPRDVKRGKRSAIDYVRQHAGSLKETGDLSRTILLLKAAGISPRDFGGRDLVDRLHERRSRSGAFDGLVNQTAFGIMALRAAGAGNLQKSAHWIEQKQNADGGFGFSPSAGSDVDVTGAALQGLAAAGRRGSDTAGRAVHYLRRAQRGDGGFGQRKGSPSNSQSTAWAIQGLLAAGRSPEGLGYLRARQTGSGSIAYSRSSGQDPVWVTGQALSGARAQGVPARHDLALARRRRRVIHRRRFGRSGRARRGQRRRERPGRGRRGRRTPRGSGRRPGRRRAHGRSGGRGRLGARHPERRPRTGPDRPGRSGSDPGAGRRIGGGRRDRGRGERRGGHRPPPPDRPRAGARGRPGARRGRRVRVRRARPRRCFASTRSTRARGRFRPRARATPRAARLRRRSP